MAYVWSERDKFVLKIYSDKGLLVVLIEEFVLHLAAKSSLISSKCLVGQSHDVSNRLFVLCQSPRCIKTDKNTPSDIVDICLGHVAGWLKVSDFNVGRIQPRALFLGVGLDL